MTIPDLSYLLPLMENVAFPALVTLFLLIRFDDRMKRLEEQSKGIAEKLKDLGGNRNDSSH